MDHDGKMGVKVYVSSKDLNQPARLRSLIKAFAVRIHLATLDLYSSTLDRL